MASELIRSLEREKEYVLRYYQLVDAGALNDLLALFDKNIVYERGGDRIEGRQELERFYRAKRKLKGRHSIERVATIGDTVVVEGAFHGVYAEQIPKKVRFADFFTFGPEMTILLRRTYLMLGADQLRSVKPLCSSNKMTFESLSRR
ncbi:MAG: nuclear transport factor 2 family protein [Bdellovibrionales bacterium]|nr:nuclear transport factor 2 family protein [Bdellovibrionales bacterium]